MADLALSGLASGVDTSALVEQLMAIERQGQTRLQTRQTSLTAQQTTLKDLKTKLDALQSAAADLRSATTWGESQSIESSDPTRVAAVRTGGAAIGGYSVKVTQLAAAAQKTYGWTQSPSASQLTIDGVTLDVGANASISDVATAINGRSDLSVYAAVVGGNKLVLSSRATGADATFSATGAQLSGPTNEIAGRNAKYLLDGDVTERESSTNVVEDAIAGVRLTFKGTTSDPASIVVGAPGIDRDKVKAEVKAFVDAYNALVTATRAKTTEKSVQNPTTQADYNKGAFFGDTSLNAMLSRLRSGIGVAYGAIGNAGSMDELREIGISTGKPGAMTEASKAGLLTLDEEALSAALEGDAQGVRRLLGGTGTSAFAQDVEALTTSLGKMLDGRIESAGTQSKQITDDLARMDTRLEAKEARLKAQFAAMETALNASNTQMAWLQGQLAGLPTWS